MSDGALNTQTALLEALLSLDPPLVTGGIFCPAPAKTPLPFVEIGDSDAIPADVQTRAGLEETFTIHVWTVFGSPILAKTIISRIRDLLHLKDLVVEDRSSAYCVVRSSQVYPDEDDKAMHGIVELRITHFSEN